MGFSFSRVRDVTYNWNFMQDPTDNLSPTGRQLLKLNPGGYQRLVITDRDGFEPARAELAAIVPRELVTGNFRREPDAKAMLAGLWLWHDFLDESHAVSQSLDTASGSFWHAIMHRREGDFSNSKYWYARCAGHPALPTLGVQASTYVNPFPADKSLLKVTMNGWNPNAFVDLVEAVHGRPTDPRHKITVALQQLEWRVLFDHCTRAAAGK
jgi:hypothetical protein